MCEHIVNRMSDVGVANLATRQPSVSTAPGRGGSNVKTHMVYTLCNHMVYTFSRGCLPKS